MVEDIENQKVLVEQKVRLLLEQFESQVAAQNEDYQMMQ